MSEKIQEQLSETERITSLLQVKKKQLQESAVKNVEAEKVIKDKLSQVIQQRVVIDSQLALIDFLEKEIKGPIQIGGLSGKRIDVPINLVTQIPKPENK